MKTSLIFALFAFASVALAANPQCLRTIEGYIYNVCPFNTPINATFQPYYPLDLTFAVVSPNAPKCDKSASSAWFTAVFGPTKGNDEGGCYEGGEPEFQLFKKGTKVFGLKIIYRTEEHNRAFTLKILCDPTSSTNSNIEFKPDQNDEPLTVTATSYSGCAVGKNFFDIGENINYFYKNV